MSNNAESSNESDDGKQVVDNQCVPPAYMNSVMRRQFLREMVKNLPEGVQNRIVALKNLQLEYLEMEAEFFKEVYALEAKYQDKYQPLNKKRSDIINAVVDPVKQEPKYKEPEEEDEEDADDDETKEMKKPDYSEIMGKIKDMPVDAKGIPNFWLTIFRNTELLSQMVQEHDLPVLKKLKDVTIRYDDDNSYTLEFHFDKNDYFTNAVLTKQYWLKFGLDEEYPFGFDGPEIFKCKGCSISWNTKMNLTVKTIRKKQKHKEHGAVRTLVKTVPNDTFFNFFDTLPVSEKDDMDEEHQELLATDFEIGHFFRAQVIPHAVLYFTGDIMDDEDDDDEDYEEEGDGDDDDDAEGGGGGGGDKGGKGGKPNECPNQ